MGPRGVDPADLVNLISGVVSAWLISAFSDEVARMKVKDLLLDSIDRRVSPDRKGVEDVSR